MHCATCKQEVGDEAFTGDVCPACRHLIHPTRLGIYQDLELIKRGGMGAVYRATHPELGTQVAIKVVTVDPDIERHRERFEREAQVAAKIPSPGVVRVYDVDLQGGRLYLVMEFVDGRTLRESLLESASRGGLMEVPWVIEKVAQLCDVLHAAHEAGVIHRDVKPENIMIDGREGVRVLDFGISRLVDADERLTRTGEILGTPEYIAPEQILDVADAVDARTDIYACGVVLYELLTGKSPFTGANIFQVLKFVESLEPPPPSELRPGLPAGLDDLVLAAMSKEQDGRPSSCAEFAGRLRALLRQPVEIDSEHRKASMPALLIAVAFVSLLVGLGLGTQTDLGLFDINRQQDASGDHRVDEGLSREPLTAAMEIEQMLGDGDVVVDSAHLQEMSIRIADSAVAEDLYWRGMARKHMGALFAALRDFEAAEAAQVSGASLQLRVTRNYVDRLYPLVLDGPMWLAAVEPKDVQVDDLKAGSADQLIIAVIDEAFAGRRASALRLLAQSKLSDSTYVPLALLRASLGDDASRRDLLQGLVERIDRTVAMRYFLELAMAWHALDMGKMNAASELAMVTGEADRATAVNLACRLWLGGRVDWRVLAEFTKDIDGLPGADVTRLLMSIAKSDEDKAGAQLRAITDTNQPFMHAVQEWRTAGLGDPFYSSWAKMSFGGSRDALSAWLGSADCVDELDVSRVCVAVSVLGLNRAVTLRRGIEKTVSNALLNLVKGGSDLAQFFSHAHGLNRVSGFDAWVADQLVYVAEVAMKDGVEHARIISLLDTVRTLGYDVDALLAKKEWEALREH